VVNALPLHFKRGGVIFILTSDLPHRENRLLAALSDEDFDLLRPHLTLVDLIPGAPVFRAGEPASYVWFPHLGVISIVAGDADGETVEIATVGREGMTGVSLILGSETMTNDAMVQVAGHGSRMEAAAFHAAVEASASLRRVMLRYILAVITQISQNAACNQLHAINTRCARCC
jgi:CRP-like cAMP-binding protein